MGGAAGSATSGEAGESADWVEDDDEFSFLSAEGWGVRRRGRGVRAVTRKDLKV